MSDQDIVQLAEAVRLAAERMDDTRRAYEAAKDAMDDRYKEWQSAGSDYVKAREALVNAAISPTMMIP